MQGVGVVSRRKAGRPRTASYRAIPIMEQVRQARISGNLNLGQFADLAGYDRQQCGDWERGRHTPSVAKFIDLCHAVGLKVVLVQV